MTRRSSTRGGGEDITYLIANYNHGRLIGECLDSLRNQTSDRWRALICDDASTDESLDAMRPYVDRERIRLIVNPNTLGKTLALRTLLHEAETDIVGILDPDDTLVPEATDRVLSAYSAGPDRSFVYSRFALFDATLSKRLGVGGRAVPPGSTALQIGGISALMTFRRTVYWETPGLDAGLDYAEDRDLVYKLEEVAQPVFVDEALYNYRRLPGSQSNDPAKREVGLRNHLRARCAALRRRQVGGLRALFWRSVFTCEYLQASHRVRASTKVPITLFRKALGRLERRAGSPRPPVHRRRGARSGGVDFVPGVG